jgi:hypothetical protein
VTGRAAQDRRIPKCLRRIRRVWVCVRAHGPVRACASERSRAYLHQQHQGDILGDGHLLASRVLDNRQASPVVAGHDGGARPHDGPLRCATRAHLSLAFCTTLNLTLLSRQQPTKPLPVGYSAFNCKKACETTCPREALCFVCVHTHPYHTGTGVMIMISRKLLKGPQKHPSNACSRLHARRLATSDTEGSKARRKRNRPPRTAQKARSTRWSLDQARLRRRKNRWRLATYRARHPVRALAADKQSQARKVWSCWLQTLCRHWRKTGMADVSMLGPSCRDTGSRRRNSKRVEQVGAFFVCRFTSHQQALMNI